MDHKKNIVGGIFWKAFEVVISRGFNLLIELILARLLLPEDYGIVGMAAVFVTFLQVFNDLGMNAALVQKKERELKPIHFDTAFWTGIVWGVFLFLLISFLGGPLAAWYYREDLLKVIIPVMSISLLLNPINLVHQAQIVKAMDFRKLAMVKNIGNIVAGIIAVILAYGDFGVWALVFYAVAKVVIPLPLFFRATGWIPHFRWEREPFKEIFGFGLYTTGTSIVNKIRGSIDFLLIGRLVGATALGYYTFALTCTDIVRDQLVSIVNNVLYPVYTTLQDDKKKMMDLFLKIISINNFIVYPLILLLFLFIRDLLHIFYGLKWDNAVPIIKVLSIGVLIQMLNNSHTTLFRAAGKVKLEFILQIIKCVAFFIPAIIIGVKLNGALGAAYGFTIATFLGVFTSLYFMKRIFDLDFNRLFNAVQVPLLMFVICLPITMFLKRYLAWWLCLFFYVLCVSLIYWIFGKALLIKVWNIARNPKTFLKK